MISNTPEHYPINVMTRNIIVYTPIVILFICFLFWMIPASHQLGFWLLRENHPVEIISFFTLFMAGVIGLQLAWYFKKHLESGSKKTLVVTFYIIFSLGLIFVAMEEVSWGQWIFGFKTPTNLGAINQQGEFNFHNIDGVQQSFEVMRVLFGIGGLIGILLSTNAFTREISAPAMLAPWFLIIAIIAALDVHNHFVPLKCCPVTGPLHFVIAAYLVEVLEMLIGLSALLYMWLNERRFVKQDSMSD